MTAATVYEQPHGANRRDRVLARYYRSVFGWPAAADATGVWLRLGDVVDALVIRARPAAQVDRILAQSLLGAPVIEVLDRRPLWIFLTQPRTPLRRSTCDDLTRLRVSWREEGSSLRLPPLCSRAGSLRWQRRPTRGLRLPPWTAVVGATRSAAGQLRLVH